MRALFRLSFIALLLAPALTTVAQDTIPYEWEAGGFSLSYPAAWVEPLPSDENNQPALQMAQVLVDTPADTRPPGIPVMSLTIAPVAPELDGDVTSLAQAALQAVGIDTLEEPTESLLLNDTAIQVMGTSADGQLFGIARAVLLTDDSALILTGRAVDAQRDDFLSLYESVAESVIQTSTLAPEITPEPEPVESAYGVLWHTQRTQADAEVGFLNFVGLDLGPDNSLYTYELDLGVVQVDATTGSIVAAFPNNHITDPSDLVVTSDGSVYVADVFCACIFTLTPERTWLDQPADPEAEADPFDPATADGLMTGFGEGAPLHLATDSRDMLYATDITSTSTIVVKVFAGGVESSQIRLGDDLFEQPLLSAAPGGQVYALTQFGQLLQLSGTEATEIDTPGAISDQMRDLAVTPDGNLVIATGDQGILILAPDGAFVDQPGIIVPNFPFPGELVTPTGVIVDDLGRLYFADSDGTFGAITALSTDVSSDRLGSTTLIPNLTVQGILDTQTTQQAWTYDGAAGERITITAVDNSGLLDLSLQLIDPSGAQAAANDDHTSPDLSNFTDAQIANLPLAASGQYIIIVQQVDGEGTYSLGLSLTGTLEIDSSGVASSSGQLDFALPANIWEFTGTEGQTLTITMESTSGDLDPLLRLVGPDEALIDENDDADDGALGTNAQIVSATLPADGLYRIEAARFDGAGSYTLTVVSTS
ncbi:MAG: hypothetical protein CL610_17130 [Anaerolineaceae bacterium]|nr:hypothetical protein [Anaerolineaceae bacterium]